MAFLYFYGMLKKILLGLLVVIVALQFIRPSRNQTNANTGHTLVAVYAVPENVQGILQRACNDCHSDYTTYPWYANIQPVGFWLDHHVEEGKEHLNFSRFGDYSKKKQAHKLEEVAEVVNEGEMPLKSYTVMHGNSKLTSEEKELLANWATTLQQQIESQN